VYHTKCYIDCDESCGTLAVTGSFDKRVTPQCSFPASRTILQLLVRQGETAWVGADAGAMMITKN